MNKRALIIMIRNCELGKVKTRLAKSIGDEKALLVYRELLRHTSEISRLANAQRYAFYSEFVEQEDQFPAAYFTKYLQHGNKLGKRMLNAFTTVQQRMHERIVVIGSDCYDLTSEILDQAFDLLNRNDVVIGPANDGGYYLLGMNKVHPEFFQEKEWGSSDVFLDTLLNVNELGLSYALLPTLDDVDREEDLGALEKFIAES